MRKWILIASGIFLLLCVVIIVAVLNINSYIARNRDYLIEQAEAAVGRRISVGEIEVSLWKGLGIRFEDFRLTDDPDFSNDDFVRAKELQANVKLLPLLRKQFQVKRVILDEPAINLIRNKQGVYNFSTLGAKDRQKEKATEDKGSSNKEARERAAFLIALMDISKGEVRYQDRRDGTNLHLRQVDLKVRDLDFNRPFSVNLAASAFAPTQNVKIEILVGSISPDSDYRQISWDAVINVDPLDVDQLKRAVPMIAASLPRDLDVGGLFRLDDVKVKGSLQNLIFNGSIDGNQGTIRYGKSFHKPAGIPLAFTSDAQYTGDRIVIRSAALKLHTLPLYTKGDIVLSKPPAISLSLDSEPAALDGWEKLIPAIADYQLKGMMDLLAHVRGPIGAGSIPQIQGRFTLRNAALRLPQVPKPVENLTAEVAFAGQQGEIKEASFDLGSSRIRLAATANKFSPLEINYKMTAPQLAIADLRASLPEQLKNDLLRNVSSDGQVSNAKGQPVVSATVVSTDGRLYNMEYKNLDAKLFYANKAATVRGLRADVLNGSVQLTGDYAFDDVPRFAMASEIKAIDLLQLYRYLNTSRQDLRGKLNGKLKLSGHGSEWQEIKTNLRGGGQTEVLEGALLNFNIANAVLSGITGIPGLTNLISPAVRKKYPETFEAKDTVFKELQTQLDLADARLNFKNLRIAAAQFRVDGDGWAGFERHVDFRGVLRFSQKLSADIAGAVREISFLFNKHNELEIPFTVSGELPNVRIRPDAGYLTRSLQRGFLQKGAEELQEQLFGRRDRSSPENQLQEEKRRQPNPAEELLRKGLEGLFGRPKRN